MKVCLLKSTFSRPSKGRIQGSVDNRSEELLSVQDRIEEQAVQLYMLGGFSNPGIILNASSVDQFLTTSEFLSAATVGWDRSRSPT